MTRFVSSAPLPCRRYHLGSGSRPADDHKRIERLMRVMGIAAIHPGRQLSRPAPGHRIYPYLLRGVMIERADQVWSTDITYLRLRHGSAYLAVIIDWFNRFVLVWELSTTLETEFCVAALDWALCGGCPEIFNTGQEAQFTSVAFTGRLEAADTRISLDGRGRALDNVFATRALRGRFSETRNGQTVRETEKRPLPPSPDSQRLVTLAPTSHRSSGGLRVHAHVKPGHPATSWQLIGQLRR